jgi:hypothetical protein
MKKQVESVEKFDPVYTYSEVKDLRSKIEDLGIDSWKEVISQMAEREEDFEVEDFRFIRKGMIDEIQCNELSSDLYILGCFNAWFLADVTGMPVAAFEAMQKAEAYEAAGECALPYIKELQRQYAAMDGYGHHFAHYDGNEHEIDEYYAFRVN